MFYVYSIQSLSKPECYYVGLTTDIERRLDEHNSGKSVHTNKYSPWELRVYVGFSDKSKAAKFEIYLKSSSGRAFCKKHF